MHPHTLELIEQLLGTQIRDCKPLSGGDIAAAYLIETSTERLFCKIMEGEFAYAMLQAEKDGLDRIRNTGVIHAPEVLFCENLGKQACLGMAFVESKQPSASEMRNLGEQLAQMHRTSSSSFGYPSDNFIGSLPQSNTQNTSWVSFYAKERLEPQFHMALAKNLLREQEIPETDKLVESLSPYLEGVTPSLLHGDLWGGNYLISQNSQPYLIDPAVYFGDPVVDLAMSRLFGGFSADFYHGYKAVAGEDPFEEDKIHLYQLYYLLVHLNLFGSSYYSGVRRIMDAYFR